MVKHNIPALPGDTFEASLMSDLDYKIRVMSPEQIYLAIEWADTEGLNPGLNDGDCFYTTDPEGSPVFLDIPEVNPAATELVSKYHMFSCFETARMYTDAFPDLSLSRTYGVTSFELG